MKVSKSRKQFLKFSFEPKNEQKYFCTSALASKKRSNQKKYEQLMILIGGFYFDCLYYFFDLTSFYRLGQKYKNIFVRFLVPNLLSRFTDL